MKRSSFVVVALGCLLVAVTTHAGLNDEATLYYTFDDEIPGVVLDHSGLGNTGDVSGATQVDDGIRGKAYFFDGQDDFLRIPAGFFSATSGYTLAAWVNVENMALPAEQGRTILSALEPTRTKGGFNFELGSTSGLSSRLGFGIDTDGSGSLGLRAYGVLSVFDTGTPGAVNWQRSGPPIS